MNDGWPVRLPTKRIEAKDILLPGGEPLGWRGRRKNNREMDGGLEGAEELFGKLRELGEVVRDDSHPGEMVEIPGIGIVGFRPVSVYGSREPTIDVNAKIGGVRIGKIKFVE